MIGAHRELTRFQRVGQAHGVEVQELGRPARGRYSLADNQRDLIAEAEGCGDAARGRERCRTLGSNSALARIDGVLEVSTRVSP